MPHKIIELEKDASQETVILRVNDLNKRLTQLEVKVDGIKDIMSRHEFTQLKALTEMTAEIKKHMNEITEEGFGKVYKELGKMEQKYDVISKELNDFMHKEGAELVEQKKQDKRLVRNLVINFLVENMFKILMFILVIYFIWLNQGGG